MIILSCDPGLLGGIAILSKSKIIDVLPMPIKKVITAPKLVQLDLDLKGKKQYVKSGPNKGKAKTKLRRAEQSFKDFDIHAFKDIIELYNPDVIVIEKQHPRPGGSSASCAKTMVNYGKLLAIAETLCLNTVTVHPTVWKEYFNVTLTKEQRHTMPSAYQTIALKTLSINKAEELSGKSFISPRGTMLDGLAEAYLIGLWYYQTKGN